MPILVRLMMSEVEERPRPVTAGTGVNELTIVQSNNLGYIKHTLELKQVLQVAALNDSHGQEYINNINSYAL